MAEAVGLAYSIVALTKLGTTIVVRLNEFQSSAKELPICFREIQTQLPLLVDTLKRTQKQADVSDETAKALKLVVDGCLSQVKRLESILTKALPTKKHSALRRTYKALSSFIHEKDVQQITSSLIIYVQNLTYHHAASSQFPTVGPSPSKLHTAVQKKCFMVQFERDPYFVGRQDVIKEIDERLKLRPHRVALAGIGGVGKSRIAIEYCYRYKDNHPEARVFWVHASNIARFEQAYKDIATELDLPGLDDPNTDILQLVSKWFADDCNGPWLCILDNADDMDILFGSGHGPSSPQDAQQQTPLLSSFLPRSSNGLTIVTTRDNRVGQKLTNNGKPIPVLPFAMSDAKSLLRPKLSSDNKWREPQAIELLKALDRLPLAITQAAAFINENDIDTAKYLELLQASDLDATHLLEEDLFDPGRDRDIRNSVFQTWKLSFNQIAKQKPRAADILSLMAFLDRQAISHELLRNDDESERDFLTSIGTLKAFSLIIEEKQGLVFGMHRLVQLSTQKWLEHQHEMVKWRKKALSAVQKCCPKNSAYENWTSWKAINPHVEVVLGYAVMGSSLLKRASILDASAGYDLRQTRLEAAHQKYGEALEIRQIKLGEEHLDTLATLGGLGLTLHRQGKYEAAYEMHRRALDGYEKALGKDHPDTLISVNNLALVFGKQGKYEAAEDLHRRALDGREKALGKDHPDTLSNVNNLALVLESQGKYEAAEDLHRRALDGREKALRRDHPVTLSNVNNLALVLKSQGKYEAAEDLHRRALDGKEKAFGKDHPNTLGSVNNLALVLEIQGKYETVEDLHRRALDGKEKALGKDHPDTLISVNNLALVFERQGKYEAAGDLHRQALDGREKTLGKDHPYTLQSVENLFRTLRNQGKHDAAEEVNRRFKEANEAEDTVTF